MSVNTENHIVAAMEAFKSGKRTIDVQVAMRGAPHFRTPAQANACCRTARKRLKIYKSLPSEAKENAQRAKREADQQSNKKTEVTDA